MQSQEATKLRTAQTGTCEISAFCNDSKLTYACVGMKAITKKLLRTENFLRCVAGVFQKRTQEELASEQASGEEGKIRQAKPAKERESDEFGERSDRGGAGEPVDFYLWSF